jgi:hypothetical protein
MKRSLSLGIAIVVFASAAVSSVWLGDGNPQPPRPPALIADGNPQPPRPPAALDGNTQPPRLPLA